MNDAKVIALIELLNNAKQYAGRCRHYTIAAALRDCALLASDEKPQRYFVDQWEEWQIAKKAMEAKK